jgi:large subunit ribosomal protein L6
MSRIGKQPIVIPENVEVKIGEDEIKVKGPQGELTQSIPPQIKLILKDSSTGQKELQVTPQEKSKKTSALWGLLRALIFNMVKGVTEGFEKKLEIEGVGYRASLQGNKLVLNLGFSHPIEIEAPAGIEFKVEKNIITVSGIDKQLVGQVAAKIRAQRKPEPYKGKGIRYLDEVIRRKAGKKTVGTE